MIHVDFPRFMQFTFRVRRNCFERVLNFFVPQIKQE